MYIVKLLKLDAVSHFSNIYTSSEVVEKFLKNSPQKEIQVTDSSCRKDHTFGTIPFSSLFIKDGYLCAKISQDFFLKYCSRDSKDDVFVYPELEIDKSASSETTEIYRISLIQDGGFSGSTFSLQAPPFSVGDEVWCIEVVPYEFKPRIVKGEVTTIRKTEDSEGISHFVEVDGVSIRYSPDKPTIFDSRESAIQSIVKIED